MKLRIYTLNTLMVCAIVISSFGQKHRKVKQGTHSSRGAEKTNSVGFLNLFSTFPIEDTAYKPRRASRGNSQPTIKTPLSQLSETRDVTVDGNDKHREDRSSSVTHPMPDLSLQDVTPASNNRQDKRNTETANTEHGVPPNEMTVESTVTISESEFSLAMISESDYYLNKTAVNVSTARMNTTIPVEHGQMSQWLLRTLSPPQNGSTDTLPVTLNQYHIVRNASVHPLYHMANNTHAISYFTSSPPPASESTSIFSISTEPPDDKRYECLPDMDISTPTVQAVEIGSKPNVTSQNMPCSFKSSPADSSPSLNYFIERITSYDICSKEGDCSNKHHFSVCSCEDKCKWFNNCCWRIKNSSPNKSSQKEQEIKKYYSCEQFYPSGMTIYGITKCPDIMSVGVDIKEKCERLRHNIPEETIPVVSGMVVYRNIFCALCHNEKDFITFPLMADDACESFHNPDILSFTDAWIAALKSPNCKLSYVTGIHEIEQSLKYCGFGKFTPNSNDTENVEIRKVLCQAYLNPVIHRGKMFRNSFCLPYIQNTNQCLNAENIKFFQYLESGGFAEPKSLRNIINFNPINYMEKTCRENELFDAQKGSCEKLICPKEFYPYYGDCKVINAVNVVRVTTLFFTTYKGQLRNEVMEHVKKQVDQSVQTFIKLMYHYNISVWVKFNEIVYDHCSYFTAPVYLKVLLKEQITFARNIIAYFCKEVLLQFIIYETEGDSGMLEMTEKFPYQMNCTEISIPHPYSFVHFSLTHDKNTLPDQIEVNRELYFKKKDTSKLCSNWGYLTALVINQSEIIELIMGYIPQDYNVTCLENQFSDSMKPLPDLVVSIIAGVGVIVFVLLLIVLKHKLHRTQ